MGTYKGERYLSEQLDSLLASTCQEWKLYLCDDGSTDRTLQIAEEYQGRYPQRIRVWKNPENLRSARNFFAGLRRVSEEEPADYYMFCDQDDRWDADKIAVSLERMQQLEREVGADKPLLVYTDSRLTDEGGRVLEPSFQRVSHFRSEHCDLAHLLMENKMPGCTEMMNTALVQKAFSSAVQAEFPADMKMHDWWFGLVAAAYGRISYLDRATMDYRQHGGNVVGGTSFGSYLQDRLADIRKQKESIRENIRQAQSFRLWYGEDLGEQQQEILQAFCCLGEAGVLERRRLLIRYGFWKSGLIRNVALFLLV